MNNDLLDFLRMDNNDAAFSASLLSLQLQLRTLFEDAGGDHAMELLDSLCKLNRVEQVKVLQSFSAVIGKILSGSVRLASAEDQHLKEFEDNLYKQLLEAFEAPSAPTEPPKLEVIPGGKNITAERRVVSFDAHRRLRKDRSSPLLN